MEIVIIETDRRNPSGKTFLKASETLLRHNKGVAHTLTCYTSGGGTNINSAIMVMEIYKK